MLGIVLFLYGLYALFRGGFHVLFGKPLARATGIDLGGGNTGCRYFIKAVIAIVLAAFCGLAGI